MALLQRTTDGRLLLLAPSGKFRVLPGPDEGGPDEWVLEHGFLCTRTRCCEDHVINVEDCVAGGPLPYPSQDALDPKPGNQFVSPGTEAAGDQQEVDEATLATKIKEQQAITDNCVSILADRHAQLAGLAVRKRAAEAVLAAAAAKKASHVASLGTAAAEQANSEADAVHRQAQAGTA